MALTGVTPDASTAGAPESCGHLLAGLDDAQRAAVISDAAPLCILAGAGSGKTRVLTRRIAHRVAQGSADPRHVLALTFTRKAASELGARLAALGVRDKVVAGTFHAVALAQLRRRWADMGEQAPSVLERKLRLIVPLLPRRRDSGVSPADIAAEIEWAKARMVPPSRYEAEALAAGRRPPLPPASVAAIYDAYEVQKRRQGLVDFDDLLLLTGKALEHDREFAAQQRWKFRHLFVDEFQDVNPAQFRLLEGWRGGSADLCVVGDPNQAIYSWNGADPSYLTDFRDRFPHAGVVRLDDNYRSSPQVLQVANAVLGGGLRASRPLRANRPDGPIPTVTVSPTDTDEALAVVRSLRGVHGSETPWSSIAVLARTNAQLVAFEQALRAAKVPCRVRGGERFLERPEIRNALSAIARRRHSPMSVVTADLLEISGGPGADEGVESGDRPDTSRPAVPLQGPAAERHQHLLELLRLARAFAELDPQGSVEGFLPWLRAIVGSERADPGGDAVELATFHAAKGLEWPVVFVTGLERGLVPIGHADTPAARAEERRLLYVAVTRAQRQLHCSWAKKRTFGARTSSRQPSPYLPDIEAALASLARGDALGDWRRHLGDQRDRLRQSKGRPARIELGVNADPEILDALRRWRTQTARSSGVPAFVICHDTTLAAMAEARPRDRQALLAVPGMGPVKVERYGEELLDVLASHAS